MKILRLPCLLALTVAILSPAAWGDYLERVGGFGGACNAVALYGDYVYAGEGTNLSIYSITNPAAPRLLDRIFLPDTVMNIAINEDIAYVADQSGGLFVYQLTNPLAPKLTQNQKFPKRMEDLALAGSTLITAMDFKLHTMDLSNPSYPVWTSSFSPSPYVDVTRVAAAENLVCAWGPSIESSGGLNLMAFVDISDPAHPVTKSLYGSPSLWPVPIFPYPIGFIRQLVISNSRVGFTCNSPVPPFEGFNILDITDPTSPTLLGHYPLQNPVGGLAIRGSWAFVTDTAGLHVFDISNPAKPMLKTNWATLEAAVQIRDNGTRSVLVDPGGTGLTMLDLTNPAAPAGKGSYRVAPEKLVTIALSGSLALTDSPTCGLQIHDISNPRFPAFKGGLDAISPASDIKTSGTIAYIVVKNGLQVADFSNPAAPILKSSYPIAHQARKLSLMGRLGLLTDNYYGIKIVDLTDPTSLTLRGSCDTPGYVWDVSALGAYAYVADSNQLQVLDIATPARPKIMTSLPLSSGAFGIALLGTKAFVTGNTLSVFDLAEPSTPTLRYTLPQPPTHFVTDYFDWIPAYPRAFGYYLFNDLDISYNAIQMFDITNPDAPVLISSVPAYSTLNNGTRFAYSDPYLFSAEEIQGIKIYRVREGPRPSRAGEEWGMYR